MFCNLFFLSIIIGIFVKIAVVSHLKQPNSHIKTKNLLNLGQPSFFQLLPQISMSLISVILSDIFVLMHNWSLFFCLACQISILTWVPNISYCQHLLFSFFHNIISVQNLVILALLKFCSCLSSIYLIVGILYFLFLNKFGLNFSDCVFEILCSLRYSRSAHFFLLSYKSW